MLFGVNPLTDIILATLGLTRYRIQRFRDVHISDGKIAVYTRCGGGNRDHWDTEPGNDYGEGCDCPGCWITYQIIKHPNYLYDRDDDFDSTYATVYFSSPEKYKELLKSLEAGDWNPDKLWLDKFEKLQNEGPTETEAEAFRPIIESLKKFLES